MNRSQLLNELAERNAPMTRREADAILTSLTDLITEPFQPDKEGYLPIPTKPGLGIELNRDFLKRFGK